MAPLNARTHTRDVRQSQPYVPQLNTNTANNPYFQKFDITQDPRNVVRELQGSVYERGFQHAWVNEEELKRETEERLRGGEGIRPMQSNFISRTAGNIGGGNSVGAGSSHW